jgi:hypothetical protein
MHGTEFTADGGSFGRGDAMLLTGFDHGARGGGVLGARFQHEDGFRPNAGFDLGQGHARIVHDIAPGWTIDAGTEVYGTHWRSAGFLSEDEFADHDYRIVSNESDGGFKQRGQERVSLRFISNAMLWRTTLATQKPLAALFSHPAGGRFEGSGSQTEEEDHRNGYGLTSALTWEGSRGELTVGTEGRWDHTNYENYFTTSRIRDSVNALVTARQLSGALFAQSHYDVGDRLRFDLGARFDEFGTNSAPDGEVAVSGSHSVLSPKLGAFVHVTPGVGVCNAHLTGFRSADGGSAIRPSRQSSRGTTRRGQTRSRREWNAAQRDGTLFRMDVSNEQTFNHHRRGNNGASVRRVRVAAASPLRAPRTSPPTGLLDAYEHPTAVSEDETRRRRCWTGCECTTRPSTSARRRSRLRRSAHGGAFASPAIGWGRTRPSMSRGWCSARTASRT